MPIRVYIILAGQGFERCAVSAFLKMILVFIAIWIFPQQAIFIMIGAATFMLPLYLMVVFFKFFAVFLLAIDHQSEMTDPILSKTSWRPFELARCRAAVVQTSYWQKQIARKQSQQV